MAMALPKNIKAILFDCDNTLVLSEERAFEGCASLINDICKKKKVPLEKEFDGPTLISEFVGQNFRGMIMTLKEKYKFEFDNDAELEGYVQEEMYRVIDKLTDVDECQGVTEQLKALDELNKPEFEKRQQELDALSEADLAELQEQLEAFKSSVDASKLLYELRKAENWKLEAAHRFNTEVARYEQQQADHAKKEADKKEAEEARKKAEEEAKAEAKAKGVEYVEVKAEQKPEVPLKYREKAFVKPEKLTASTPLLLVVVSSSAKARVEVSVEEGKMLPYFGTRIFSAATSLPKPTSKPNPAIYQFAMEQHGLRPEECIAVEDSVSGATAGVSAGIPTIGYVWPYTKENPDKSEEMAVTLKNLKHYETKDHVEVTNIMRHWREFPERLREIDEAAGKPKAAA